MNGSAMIKGHQFLVLGRIGMDIYPPPGEKIETATTLEPALGGSSGNIAAGLARLGNSVQMVSRVSDDPVGRFVRNQCVKFGIGTKFLASAPLGTNTNLALAENVLESFEVVIYRNGAADLTVDAELIDQINFSEADALVVTGTALSSNPSHDATLSAMQKMCDAGGAAIIDIDFRAAAWNNDLERARAAFEAASAIANIVIGNDDEFDVIAPGRGLERARDMGADRLVIYKMGANGATAIHNGVETFTDIFRVDALKPVGAGDAFMAGFLTALADGVTVDQAVQNGAANAAIVVSRPACAPAMATRDEIKTFILERS